MRKKPRLLILTLFILAAALNITNAHGQAGSLNVSVDQILYNRFPVLEARVSVLDLQGFPILGLTENDFLITEDGRPVGDFQVKPYQHRDEALAVVLAIDTSGSMRSSAKPSPMDNAIAAAQAFIAQLSPQDQVGVITFADSVEVLTPLTSNKAGLDATLETLEAKGATAINDAIVEAVNMLQNRAERRAIILLTDGKPEGTQTFSFDQALSHASNRAIPIYPIGFGSVDQNQLKRLAELTGGAEQIQPDSATLDDAFSSILNIFREKYLFEITSSIPPDNQEHELVIGLNYQGASQKGQEKFIAREPVQVSIESPDEGDIISETINIDVVVDMLNPISQVDFFIDDELAESLNSEPFVFYWDTTRSVTGEHVIRVAASDQMGFSAEDSRNVVIELQRNDWIFWLIGIVVLIALAIFLSLGLRRRQAPPAAARKAVLVEIEGLQIGKHWPLDAEETSLGRRLADNDIGLKGTNASRNHAIIQRTREGYIASCLKSANPLIINDEKVERAKLEDGDVIKMGESTFRFEYQG
jgi:VWFA-related protein